MTYHKLGQKDKAKETYEKALDRHRRHGMSLSPNHWHELYEFRVEAATLFLGEPPQQVFERAGELARTGDWESAAAQFTKALDVYPGEHWHWYLGGALLAYLNRPDEYRNHCRRMLNLFGDTQDPFIAERAGKLCLLLPGEHPNDSRAAQLCDKAMSMRPEVSWFQLASAIAKYRAGQFQDALDRLRIADAQAGEQVYCRVLIELFRAMSQHQLGKQEAAQDSLKKAIDRLNATAPTAEDEVPDYGPGWHDRLMGEVIRREAEALISS
jgi:tetratricopeptide (TPR) repeat protein